MSLSATDPAESGEGAIPAWRNVLESRYVVGGGYAVAALLTITGALLVSSPPAAGPIGPAVKVMLVVLGLNLVLILGLALLVGMRVARLLRDRNVDAGARLHLRFMGLFGLAAVAPADLGANFLGGLVPTGGEAWFGAEASLAEVGYWMIEAKHGVELRRQGCIWLTRFPTAETAKRLATLGEDPGTPEPVPAQAPWARGDPRVGGGP